WMESAARAGQGECGTVRSKLGRYHRGLLSRKKRAAVAVHLADCDSCQSCYVELVELFGHRIERPRRNGKADQ
ncbi:MAG: zf-HC2 domain-containing protein, partial [Actinobacteria bacterium]|nr:zf-HC2 domain-containing protein [Actinomycetota bacterium]